MNPILKQTLHAANATAVGLYRRSNGRIGGKVRGTDVLLLTVVGRKSGQPHTVAVSFFEHDGEFVIVGSGGGSKQEPQWVRNLAVAGQASIQIRDRVQEVSGRIAESAERDRLWNEVVLASFPFFAKYQEKAGRTIPVAVLTPRD
jgi:deazaflavin-dependent oxidoreductase (nitroreductase family)